MVVQSLACKYISRIIAPARHQRTSSADTVLEADHMTVAAADNLEVGHSFAHMERQEEVRNQHCWAEEHKAAAFHSPAAAAAAEAAHMTAGSQSWTRANQLGLDILMPVAYFWCGWLCL